MEFTGNVLKVFADKCGWAAIKVELTDGRILNASGRISAPIVGTTLKMEGEKIDDPKYGAKIEVKASEMSAGMDRAGIIAFLSSGNFPGIGPTTANNIVDMFGSSTLEIIEKTPENLSRVKGISAKRAEDIHNAYGEVKDKFELYKLLNGKVSINQINKILERYKNEAVDVIKKTPYQLIYDMDGIGFAKADNIARASGFKADSMDRISAAIVYTLKTMSEKLGHCYSTAECIEQDTIDLLLPLGIKLTPKVQKYLRENVDDWDEASFGFYESFSISPSERMAIENWVAERDRYLDIISETITILIKKGILVVDGDEIYWKKLYNAEINVARILVNMIKQGPLKKIKKAQAFGAIEDMEVEEGISFEKEQKDAVWCSLKNRVSVITGGPGRGKTTILKAIIKAWGDPDDVFLCAPTGKAAQRMRESTGLYAETVQRLATRLTTNKFRECDSRNILIIADESSMFDLTLAEKFLYRAKDCQIIFVGDIDQLPSIGAGNFFRDIVLSPVIPTTKLTFSHRLKGAIANNAENINTGKSFSSFIFDESFKYEEADKDNIQDKILSTYKDMLTRYDKSEICILSPMRQRGNSCTNTTNTMIHDKINPYHYGDNIISGVIFREGDRVMNTSNYYTKLCMLPDGTYKSGVFNGDCGTITKIDKFSETLEVRFDDGRIVTFQKYEFENLTLAYAMTVHKSQGSEYKAVILTYLPENYIMYQRALLYTGVTRAKQEIVLLGAKSSFNGAIHTIDSAVRNTNLRMHLMDFATEATA